MAVDAINAGNAADTQASRKGLADNYDTFLVLLTAQLQNQDPLSPMDSTQFTQQLVQFSQVEQQIRTNEQLGSLVSHYQAATAGTALSYLGRDAIIESDTAALSGGKADWTYTLPDTADSIKIEVRNSSGKTVYSVDGEKVSGNHSFSWDGRTTLGGTAPDGAYTLVITAKDADGEAIDTTTTVRENIVGVDFSSDTPVVVTASGSHEIGDIRAILDNET